MRTVCWAMALLAIGGCKDQEHAAASPPPSAAPSAPAPALASSVAAAPVRCNGLAKAACVMQQGCLLDQPAPGIVVCRATQDACEASVRQADLFGPMRPLPGVTAETGARARAVCLAQPACTVTSGHCSCACGVLDDCDCACGGSYLPRCARKEDAPRLEGVVGGRGMGDGGS